MTKQKNTTSRIPSLIKQLTGEMSTVERISDNSYRKLAKKLDVAPFSVICALAHHNVRFLSSLATGRIIKKTIEELRIEEAEAMLWLSLGWKTRNWEVKSHIWTIRQCRKWISIKSTLLELDQEEAA